MIDSTDFREDPLYLPKDTKVFVMYDHENMDDTIQRNRTIDMYGALGYTCSAQRLVSVGTINNSYEELGFDGIMTSRRDLSVLEIRQWYTFINILRKARVLQKHFIVSFTGYNVSQDIPRSNLDSALTVFPNGSGILVSTTEADRIIKVVLSKSTITHSVKQYLISRAKSL